MVIYWDNYDSDVIDVFVAILADPSYPNRGFLNPAIKQRGVLHTGMAEGKWENSSSTPCKDY